MTRPAPAQLLVDGLDSPLGLATAEPRFSWRLAASGPDLRQEAYELTVSAGGVEVGATGRVESRETVGIRVPGLRLDSRTAYRWAVRVWIEGDAEAGEWAESGYETSLLDAAEWTAPWATPEQRATVVERYSLFGALSGTEAPSAPLAERLHPPQHLRQEFDLEAAPLRARLRMTARGVYLAELNGARVGDEVLAPGFDSYGERTSFQTYDVTGLLGRGANVLGVVVADGWYAGRIGLTGASAQYGDQLAASWILEVDEADGSTRHIIPDAGVLSARGPRDWADLFIGERHDARLEADGWSTPGFDAGAWAPVRLSSSPATGLVPFAGEPVRRVQEFAPAAVLRTPSGDVVVDAGQVVAGRVRLTVRAAAGTEIVLEHSESLTAGGEYFANILGPNKDQTDVYVAAGREGEVFEPEFTFHGFRYVRVTGLPDLVVDDVTIVVLNSDLRETSRFRASDDRLTRLHENVLWSQRANFLSIPTDCPQRERAGWTGDLQVFMPAAATNMAVQPFTERWLANLRADQHPTGEVPMIVPVMPHMDDSGEGIGSLVTSAGWGDAVVIVPWVLYERYGDAAVLRDNYAAMVAWVEYQMREAGDGLLWNTGFHFGDWLAPSTLADGSPDAAMVAPALTGAITAAMFHAYSLELLARVARVLGEDADAERFEKRHDAVAAAFADEYVSPEGHLSVELQGPYVNALAFRLIPADRRAGAVARLVELVHAADDHLDTGFVSVPYLLDVLWDHGHRDLARTLLMQDTMPSWLYEVKMGATTIWESWAGVLPDGTPQAMSMNHYAFGCVDDWMFRRLAGVAPTAPGYREFVVEPDVEGALDGVDATIETPSGEIAVSWRREPGAVALEVEVPPNTTATLVLGDRREVVGSGRHTLRSGA